MRHSPVLRIIFDIALFFSVLYLPWWVSAVCIVVGIAVFRSFYESLIAAFLVDTLYGHTTHSILRTYPFSSITAGLFLVSFWLKGLVRIEHF